LLERKSAIDALQSTGEKPERFRGDVSFQDVYFNYPSRPDVKVRTIHYFTLLYISFYQDCLLRR
jgi:hypothetical protein